MGKIDQFQVVDFSLLLPRTCCWNLSVIENYKFDLWFFHRAEFRPLTEAIKRPPNCEHLTTYIIYLLHTAVFTILEQGQRLPSSTLNYNTTVGNKQLFTSSQLHAWITKTSAPKAASLRNQRGSFRVLMTSNKKHLECNKM